MAKIGIEIHKLFILKLASKLTKDIYWETTIRGIQQVLANTMPKILLETGATLVMPGGELKLGFTETDVMAQSFIHLSVVNYVKTVVIREAAKHMPLKV